MTDHESLRRGMAGCTHVFHVAAYAKNWAADPQVFTAQNVEGVRNVLAVAGVGSTSRCVDFEHRHLRPDAARRGGR